mmetsp:Transcript_40819/g.68379  ORF Transcript_40819/g.68379 Transcript_40819/m.68379 type:complete len:314 (+) Transcript_40819:124-1065(+)
MQFGDVVRVGVGDAPPEVASNRFCHSFRGIAPYVMTDFARTLGWSAPALWAARDYLRTVVTDTAPTTPVSINTSGAQGFDPTVLYDPTAAQQSIQPMRWAEAIDCVFKPEDANDQSHTSPSDGPRYYLKSYLRDELRADVQQLPDRLLFQHNPASPSAGPPPEKIDAKLTKVWIGSEGNVTPLHFDHCHGLVAQVVGAKRVIMYPPSESSKLHPFPSGSGGAQRASRVDLTAMMRPGTTADAENKEREMYPLAWEAQGVACDIAAGEALYIPPFWWHHITALDDNVSVLMPFDLSPYEQRTADRPWCRPEWGM